jgi:hypothetical protein
MGIQEGSLLQYITRLASWPSSSQENMAIRILRWQNWTWFVTGSKSGGWPHDRTIKSGDTVLSQERQLYSKSQFSEKMKGSCPRSIFLRKLI